MLPIIFENAIAPIITTTETIIIIKNKTRFTLSEADVKSDTGPSATTNQGVPSHGETE